MGFYKKKSKQHPYIQKKNMSFVNLLLGAVALYATDMILTPMLAGSELMRWLKLGVQAYVLNVVYNNMSLPDSTSSR